LSVIVIVISKLSPLILDKAIRSAVGTAKTVRSLRNGDNLGGCPITANPHRTLNCCKGVIRCGPLVDCDKDEIISELKPQVFSDIANITVKDDSGSRRNTNTFIITFKATSIPKHLNISYIRIPVSPYIHNPLRCFK